MPTLLQRLKERKLFQWALAYLAGAWLVFQGIEVLAEPWNLSEAVQRSIHVLLGVGFFVTLVLAWYHGEKGRQRASGVELLILAGILVIAGAAVAALGRERDDSTNGEHEAPRSALDQMSIAVLPFVNRSAEQGDEYFTDGMHDEILTLLCKISSLSVRGRTSVMQYRDTEKNLRQIGEELNARYILEGGVQRSGGTVRINLQLVDAESDEHVWAETYDRPLTVENLLGVQSEVALRVAEALKGTLTPDEAEEIEQRPTDNLEAYDYYLRGLEFYRRTYGERDSRIAVEMFERATQLDSGFALAYAKLSRAHSRIYWWYYDRSARRLEQAKLAADRSLALQPNLAEAHEALGYYYYWGHLDLESALAEFETALSRQPSNSDLLANVAYVQRRRGNFKVAVDYLEKAARLDPRDALTHYNLGNTHGESLRNYPEAERYYDQALALAPDLIEAYALKTWLYFCWDGNTSKARGVLEQAAARGLESVDEPALGYAWVLVDRLGGDYDAALSRLSSGSSPAFSTMLYYMPKALLAAQIYDLRNEPQLARQHYDSAAALLEARIEAAPEDARLYSALGIAYAGLGRVEEAIRAGERGVDLLPVEKDAIRGLDRVEDLARILTMTGQHDAAIDQIEYLLAAPGDLSVARLRIDRTWDPLRGHPRFQALLANYQ